MRIIIILIIIIIINNNNDNNNNNNNSNNNRVQTEQVCHLRIIKEIHRNIQGQITTISQGYIVVSQ